MSMSPWMKPNKNCSVSCDQLLSSFCERALERFERSDHLLQINRKRFQEVNWVSIFVIDRNYGRLTWAGRGNLQALRRRHQVVREKRIGAATILINQSESISIQLLSWQNKTKIKHVIPQKINSKLKLFTVSSAM